MDYPDFLYPQNPKDTRLLKLYNGTSLEPVVYLEVTRSVFQNYKEVKEFCRECRNRHIPIPIIVTPSILNFDLQWKPGVSLYAYREGFLSIPKINSKILTINLIEECSQFSSCFREKRSVGFFYDHYCGTLPKLMLLKKAKLMPITMGDAVLAYAELDLPFCESISAMHHRFLGLTPFELDSMDPRETIQREGHKLFEFHQSVEIELQGLFDALDRSASLETRMTILET